MQHKRNHLRLGKDKVVYANCLLRDTNSGLTRSKRNIMANLKNGFGKAHGR